MIEIRQTVAFASWHAGLKDEVTRARIAQRIDRLRRGNPGDVRSVGGGVSELRLDFGAGYRLYYARRGAALIVLLCGGDKSTQKKDIKAAKAMAREWKG
jgi:putative addiction module killer protein